MNSRPGVTATTDMAVLPCVLGCRPLRRTIQVRLGTNPAVPWDGCPARGASACAARGTPIFMVSRQQFMKYPGSVLVINVAHPVKMEAHLECSSCFVPRWLKAKTIATQ